MNLDSVTRTGTTLGGMDIPPDQGYLGWTFDASSRVDSKFMQVTTENPEADLLAGVARGDMEAFSQIYDRFAGTMFSVAFRILQDNAAAEDAVQEAFLQIWEKAASYQAVLGRPITWAITLARNRAIDRLRSTQRSLRLTEAVTEEYDARAEVQQAADAPLLSGETADAVRVAVKSLNAEQRQAIEMAYFAGLSQTEIAAALGVPLGTVKARIRRGMLLLREALESVL